MGIDAQNNSYTLNSYLSGKKIPFEEEFKVDKLGWYKTKYNKYYKVIHIRSEDYEEPYYRVICIDEKETDHHYHISGRHNETAQSHNFDLIEYIGPELPVKPREFEFVAEMIEFPYTSHGDNPCIDMAVGHGCGPLSPKILVKKIEDGNKKSKWHFTMTEIIDE